MGKEELEIQRSSVLSAEEDSMGMLNIDGAGDALGSSFIGCKVEYCKGNCPAEYVKGDFTFYESGSRTDQAKELNVVWLTMNHKRVNWPKYDPKDEDPKPSCQSDNAQYPSSGGDMEDYDSCDVCPLSKFVEDKKNKTIIPPKCKEVFNLLLFDIEESRPFLLPVSGTSIKPLKRVFNEMKRKSKKMGYPGLYINCCVLLKIKTIPSQDWFVLDFKIGEQLDLDEATLYNDTSKALREQFEMSDVESNNESEEL